jgi:hypothetical protein
VKSGTDAMRVSLGSVCLAIARRSYPPAPPDLRIP